MPTPLSTPSFVRPFAVLLSALPCSVVLVSGASTARADVVTLEPSADNTLYEDAAGGLSNGTGDSLFSGVTGEGLVRRALLRFDVAGAVPAGATITSASLKLSMSQSIAGATEVALHRLTASFGEGTSHAPGQEGAGAAATTGDATWLHTSFATDFWSTPGGDFDASASATTTVDFVGDYHWTSVQLALDVQAWLDGSASNHGWLVRHADEATDFTAKRFDSRDNATASARPILTIEFQPASCGATNYCTSAANSTGSPATIGFNGSCRIADDTFELAAGPVPDQPGLFFYSLGQTAGGAGLPFGNGTRCVGNSGAEVFRLDVHFASSGALVHALDFSSPPSPGGQILGGSTWHFQAWFRDPAAGGAAFDFSDALTVTFE